jgi:type II secretory pathway pseudopilin PulG
MATGSARARPKRRCGGAARQCLSHTHEASKMAAAPIARTHGFTYLAALLAVTLVGFAAAAAGSTWSALAPREREIHLLWVGTQYAQALRSYYRRSPGRAQYPLSLEDLLDDRRLPVPQRHLRRLYPDPLTGGEWGLIRTPDGRIAGVFSLAQGEPRRQANFPPAWQEFERQKSYAGWRFVADDALRSPLKTDRQ